MGHPDSLIAGQKHLIDELESSFHVIAILYSVFIEIHILYTLLNLNSFYKLNVFSLKSLDFVTLHFFFTCY